jgi:hypothetical protein
MGNQLTSAQELIQKAYAAAEKAGSKDNKDFVIGYLAQTAKNATDNAEHYKKLWEELFDVTTPFLFEQA